MTKTILITGATDGLGRETARKLASEGHKLLIHGRNIQKLAATADDLRGLGAEVDTYRADLSDLTQVAAMAREILVDVDRIDVVINNAGVFRTDHPRNGDGQDVRFVVNTLAPALLTQLLLPILPKAGRVVHLSSAAQAPVNLGALADNRKLEAMEAYAQSKLALTMWSQTFAEVHADGPVTVAVNPGSLLATNMVREGFGVAGIDIGIGADILRRAALSQEFADASGQYFDNDSGRFAAPHRDAADPVKVAAVVAAIDKQIAHHL